jgi:hypothetical protein
MPTLHRRICGSRLQGSRPHAAPWSLCPSRRNRQRDRHAAPHTFGLPSHTIGQID